uniref:Uncharacterized protein n=1 Tax=Nephromyces sp. ex Molgula occidentalis TaxID=2544991 RepID=A0A5C1H902_9APIC|nr:hypothetical protein [Nephromyces sp. ex Molgula occidentalis]
MIKCLLPCLISLKIKNLIIIKTSSLVTYKFLIAKHIDKIYLKSIYQNFLNLQILNIRTHIYSKNTNFKKVFITIKL